MKNRVHGVDEWLSWQDSQRVGSHKSVKIEVSSVQIEVSSVQSVVSRPNLTLKFFQCLSSRLLDQKRL